MTVRETLHNLLHVRLRRQSSRQNFDIPPEMDAPALDTSLSSLHRPFSWAFGSPATPTPSATTNASAATPAPSPGSTAESESAKSPTTPVRKRKRPAPAYTPRLSSASSAMRSPAGLTALQLAVPARHHAHDWQKVYSTMRDGISLQTLYANCAGADPIMLLIRDTANHTFGCFTTTSWQPHTSYYGNGETFVFTLSPSTAVFKWSKQNSYFQLSGSDSFALGGGGKFALFVDSMLEHGTSGVCATFANPCLASKEEFDIVVLEAFKLVPPHKFKVDEDVVESSSVY